jgi:hypothetical protein
MIEGVLPLTIDQQSSIFFAKKKKKTKFHVTQNFFPPGLVTKPMMCLNYTALRVELHVGLTITLFVVRGVRASPADSL